MKIPKSGQSPIYHREITTPQDGPTQHRPSPVSQPPEPVPMERPSRVPLNKLIHGSTPEAEEKVDATTSQNTRKLSSWLRLQLTELRHTAESVFAGKDEQEQIAQKTDTIEQAVWHLKDELETGPQTPMPATIQNHSQEVEEGEQDDLPPLDLPPNEYSS